MFLKIIFNISTFVRKIVISNFRSRRLLHYIDITIKSFSGMCVCGWVRFQNANQIRI